MGIEVPAEYGGSESSFLSSMLVVEEISRVDAAVAALVDIHGTLVGRFFKLFGSKEQKEKYLPKLATSWVRVLFHWQFVEC